jgi:hypothetical protein
MKNVLKNKKRLALIGVAFICAVAGLAILYNHQQTNKNQEGRIVTKNFSIARPDGITKDESSRGNIYFTIAKPYGELRVAIERLTLDITWLSQRGDITESTVTVDGVSARRQAINLATVISGQSSKLLMRYEVEINKIPKPSAKDYTSFSVTAFSKNDITASDITDTNQVANELLSSLIIK